MSELSKLKSQLNEKSKLQRAQRQIMKLFIVSSSIIFLTLLCVWLIQLRPESITPKIYLWSTLFIVVSSVSIYMSKISIQKNDLERAANYVILSVGLGVLFGVTQLSGWFRLVETQQTYKSILMPFAMIHFGHITVGIVLLIIVWFRIRDYQIHSRAMAFAKNVFYFWHFLGLIWITFIAILS